VSVNDALAPGVARFKHIDQPFGIRIRAVGAQRMGPLLPAENPWEEGSVTITTVIQDQGMYRGWAGPFTTSGDPPGQKHYMYFESHDGVTWKRPKLGIVEEKGSRQNNIVNIFGTDGGSIFLDPSAPASERYKLIAEMTYPPEIADEYLRKRPNDWDPNFGSAYWALGLIYEAVGMLPEALAAFQTGADVSGGVPRLKGALGRCHALAGNTSKALEILAGLQSLADERYVSPFEIALIYMGLGDVDKAFEALEKVYAVRSYELVPLRVDPRFDCLRADRRFSSLLQRMGLERPAKIS
jgi:hypothetical protein